MALIQLWQTPQRFAQYRINIRYNTPRPADGRGASVSAYAGLTNQLLSCWVDPRIAWKNTDTAIVGDRWTGVWGHPALYC